MAIEGVFTRQKCAAKWCATFWDPVSPNLVSLNSKIFNFHDVRHSWRVSSSPNGPWTSKLVLGFSSKARGCRSGGLRRKYILKNDPQQKTFGKLKNLQVSWKWLLFLLLFMVFVFVAVKTTVYGTLPYWAPVSEPGFLDFQIFRCSILEFLSLCNIISTNTLVRYRGINDKGVLERPWTKRRVLRAISSTLKFQFTVKCRKVDFLTSSKTRSCESSREKFRMVRALLPDTPRPPQFQPELQFSHFLPYFRFFQFFPGSLTSA